MRKRLAKLSGGVAVINVGAATEIELKEKKMRIDDALHATKAAVEEGVVAGGGITLFHAKKQLESLHLQGEQLIGANIVKKSLEMPLRQIALNAGKDGSEIIAMLNNLKDETIGYDAKKDSFVKLFDEVVIDPTKVVRNALQTSASIAALVLTTEALVADLEEKDNKSDFNPSMII